ncbi:DUF3152 domain-containing protein [Streptomyces radiopugnans]|nr:DUF3152 domain-containing protein [Streptomyces radiopugnans]
MGRLFDLAPDFEGSGGSPPSPGGTRRPARGEVVRYRVDVEDGLPLDGELFAEAVHRTLNDERSWSHGGARTFERVSGKPGESGGVSPAFVITLASPSTTAKWCARSGLDTTVDNVSCDSASTERVMINAYRWARGADTFGPDRIREYREMLINHEVGHRLGKGHVNCPKEGALAPVMMQQTKYLTVGGATCLRPNAWPFPDA